MAVSKAVALVQQELYYDSMVASWEYDIDRALARGEQTIKVCCPVHKKITDRIIALYTKAGWTVKTVFGGDALKFS